MMSGHRGAAYSITQLRKADSGRLRGLRQQAGSRHTGHGIHLKAPDLSGVVEPEIGSTIGTCLYGTVSFQAETSNETARLCVQISWKDFFGPVRLVLARVVEDVVKLWANLAHGQSRPFKDPDRQLAPRHEALDHDLIVVSERCFDRWL
jgi:hypothetical protein